jgi:hypothetical protein
LPEDAFGKFVEAEAVEVHLATNFMNMLYDRLPAELLREIYLWLDDKHAADRKADMTNEQFYYKTRKNAIGPFKNKLWNLSPEVKSDIENAWEDQFRKLFRLLGLEGTRQYVDQTIQSAVVKPERSVYLGEAVGEEDVTDLAD